MSFFSQVESFAQSSTGQEALQAAEKQFGFGSNSSSSAPVEGAGAEVQQPTQQANGNSSSGLLGEAQAFLATEQGQQAEQFVKNKFF